MRGRACPPHPGPLPRSGVLLATFIDCGGEGENGSIHQGLRRVHTGCRRFSKFDSVGPENPFQPSTDLLARNPLQFHELAGLGFSLHNGHSRQCDSQ